MTVITPVGVGVVGASGYTGYELVRLLSHHPGARLEAIVSRQYAGQAVCEAFPGLPDVALVFEDMPSEPRHWVERGIEVVFAALPHGAFAAQAQAFVDAGLRIVDLSADFRLKDAAEYPRRYHREHPNPGLLPSAVYGLCEWAGDALTGARFVANPGCYTTASLLAALPAVQAGWWSGASIIINAVSGVSGAGRSATLGTHFVECGNSVTPYKVGESHAHLGELCQVIGEVAGCSEPSVVFNPHLVPMARGIVATVAVPMAKPISAEDAQRLYTERYRNAPFVRMLKGAALPETRHVRGSNRCDLAVRVAAGGSVLLIFSAIDNLLKGAAGQAVQNWNRMQGWPETLGLPMDAWSIA